jgi:hypothetical protein
MILLSCYKLIAHIGDLLKNVIHSFVYIPWVLNMARKPVDVEIVNDNKISHVSNIITK